MYRGFALSGISFEQPELFEATGKSIFDNQRAIARNTLKPFVTGDGVLDGVKLLEEWFPALEADIFISHSHKDEELAQTFAGWLKENFGLTAFIDSAAWGYADNLLAMIDHDWCKQDDDLYSYQRRNGSTSYVHTMLSAALGMMIDKAECLFFLNTANSITSAEEVSKRTESAWLFAELQMARIVRKQRKERRVTLNEKIAASKSLRISLPADIDFLASVDADMMNRWVREHNRLGGDALNVLYNIVPEE